MAEGGGLERGTAGAAVMPLRRSLGVQSRRVPDVEVYPFRAVGRLRVTQGGHERLATACVVGPGLVYTSAANLWAGGEWSTEVSFELRYDDGRFVGPFTPRPGSLWVPDAWRAGDTDATTTFDLGTFEADPPLPADEPLHPRSILGRPWLGLTGMAIGYGGPGGLDPDHMYLSVGPVDYLFPFLGQLGSDLGAVAAGGPWLVDFGLGWSMVGSTGLVLAEFEALVSPPFIPLVVPFLDPT
jgi:hypothetical protein